MAAIIADMVPADPLQGAANFEVLEIDRSQRVHKFSNHAISNLTSEDQLLFERFGQGPCIAVPHACIHHAFEAHSLANPNAVAAIHLEDHITYGDLDRHANRLAAHLAELGVSTNNSVALFVQRSIPMLVGMLAVLKAGAAYVPQDVGVAPEAQLRHVIQAASTKVILTLSNLRHLVPVPDGHVCIAIDEFLQDLPDDQSQYAMSFKPAVEVRHDHRCFILFTSGTTGTPNGVQVTHANVCNILLTEPGSLGMRPGMKVGQILNIAFDMAAWETLGCLAHGATLVIRGKDFQKVAEAVDVIIATPSILGALDADRCRNVKTVAVAGEPCPKPLADKWTAFCTFYNACGPTETTIVNTAQHYTVASGHLTIGKPTPNNTVYILDANLVPCVIGEAGEMWAGGDCVSAGYLHNDQLNQERYIPDPFLGSGRMMFRTRDLGRWTRDGDLEHLGRVDDQVKIRGFRVELDSVSGIMESTPSCTHAVTLKLNNSHLVGFVCPSTVDVESARKRVSAALPYYCTPTFVIAMDSFPMTSRGKIDKQLLMAIAAGPTSQSRILHDGTLR